IVAGSLRDNARAEVVGETTFGTGTVLAERTLSDGSAILLGIAEWLTPNGDFIRESGIEPDVEVKLAEGQEPLIPGEEEEMTREEILDGDAQLSRAFEVLEGVPQQSPQTSPKAQTTPAGGA
ncbi:MAG: S41 family peptidase, partial [Actinomycetota bacterium]|nr:S41 family peptidase [Actinomycetota bacterium]